VLPEGYYVVSTAQPQGSYAAFLLEPKSNDGLCYWNYYDPGLFAAERGTGSFDICKTETYSAIPADALDDVVIPTEEVPLEPDADDNSTSGSGSGCSSFSFMVVALLVLIPATGRILKKCHR
jgi:hypothetical protein